MKPRFSTGLLCICLASISLLNAEERFSFEKTPGKLPKHVIPRHYAIELKPDLEALTLAGHEILDLEVTKPAKEIVLNSAELEISSARLVNGPTLQINVDKANQLLTLSAPAEIGRGKYQLELSFTGKINESAAGMFYIDYTAPSGKKRMIATQFEATDARRVFPCFDEPVFRSTFALTAELPATLTPVSNMPLAQTEAVGGGWKRVQFQRTPSMPVYLLALVAGELEEIHEHAGRTETHIWFTEGKKEQARYALESSKRLLAFYNNYFGIRFPLPKLDHIAMPGGFGGAMEHWGAITYNEGTILYDPQKSSHDQKERSFGIMAHEMAHQWFGNLVTMAWWDNLWLNEGFASWMGTKATDTLNPDWQTWVRTDAGKSALMARDARKSSHPIQRPVTSESQIGDAFDDITYTKGMFFIRMLEDYVGEKAFREGLKRYLKRHSFGNTTTADLWAALAEASHQPVAEFAADWTEQAGLPVILASGQCIDGKQEITLQQERFSLLDPSAAPLRWKVPVSALAVANNKKMLRLVEGTPTVFRLGTCDDAIKLNVGSRGYYRVAYDRSLFQKLRDHWDQLSEADRVSLLGDAWAMVETGKLTAEDYLDILSALGKNRSLPVWENVSASLSTMNLLLSDQPFQAAFQKRVATLCLPLLKSLGFQSKSGERSSDGLLRARLLALLGALGDPEVVAEAKRRFSLFVQDPTTLTGDLRSVMLGIVGEHATPAEYEQLTQMAKSATLEEDRQIFLNALVQPRDAQLVRRTLELSLTKDFPPVQAATLVSGVSAGARHAEAAWDFMKQHHRELLALVQGPFENMYAGSTVAGFADDTRADEYVHFIRTNYPPDALAKAEEAADKIRYNAFLKRQILASVRQWSADTQR